MTLSSVEGTLFNKSLIIQIELTKQIVSVVICNLWKFLPLHILTRIHHWFFFFIS